MKDRSQLEHMAEVAKRESGWDPADMTRRLPVDAEIRAYAEGVEAALRWALEQARTPFPR